MKRHVFAPNIIIGISFYWFEAGQKLVQLRSNYFSHDGQRAHSLLNKSEREIEREREGEREREREREI